MPGWLSFILGILADWLKRLADPEFERKQADLHKQVRQIEEAAKRHDERVAGYRAEADRIANERETLATDEAATEDAIERLQKQIDEERDAPKPALPADDRDAVRLDLGL